MINAAATSPIHSSTPTDPVRPVRPSKSPLAGYLATLSLTVMLFAFLDSWFCLEEYVQEVVVVLVFVAVGVTLRGTSGRSRSHHRPLRVLDEVHSTDRADH